ncbi:MAG: NUDIX domain-containing protein [Planctomycetota bacterium]
MPPKVRSDIIDAYVFRRVSASESTPAIEVLQLRRTQAPAPATWHPVMGHIEPGERATDTLWRELAEELDLAGPDTLHAWALEQIHPFYIADLDAVFLSPRFAVEVTPDFEPKINDEHDDFRWLTLARAMHEALWPGQRAALRELHKLLEGDPSAELLKIERPD